MFDFESATRKKEFIVMDFIKFKTAVAQQFSRMSKYDLFFTSVSKDVLWDTYLNSFPANTNPIFRERTEHDCSCCRSFVKTIGNVAAIIDGKLVTIWDAVVGDPAYQAVSDAMSKVVKGEKVDNIFLHTNNSVGTNKNYEQILEATTTWEHFYLNIPNGRRGEKNFVCTGVEMGPRHSESRSSYDVLLRSLNEITTDAIGTVLDLIAQNSLYRGEEQKFAVSSFQKLKGEFDGAENKDLFVWSNLSRTPSSICRIRNTAIGTLLCDLSDGVDLDIAVRSFESKVAPANYKRPTALVTRGMVEGAKNKIAELGLTSALERRYATLADLSINDVLFANRAAKSVLEKDVFDLIETKGRAPKKLDKVDEISIEKFLRDVVPTADSIEIMFDNAHSGNLVSLITSVDPTATGLFKWGNNFSWSYNGDMADSVKERVKRAGGNVSGDLCCRLGWYNHDDLDFYMVEPNGYKIYFGNKRAKSPSGGQLDVDMNAGGGTTRSPVENIFYENHKTMANGVYRLVVNNFQKRESTDVGFEVEIDFMGSTYNFSYTKALKTGEDVVVAKFKYSRAEGFVLLESLPCSQSSKTVWDIKTNDFRNVGSIMLSPNFWNEPGIGNKHYFFMLEDCRNDGQARGFYNEFLKEELNPHRKVIEMVGSKMKTEHSDNQLSGLGFSSTQRNEILVKVTGNFSRMVKVVF